MGIAKSNLSKSKQRFIELLRDIYFGRITNFDVRDGEPELTAETVIEREIKLGGQNGPRSVCGCKDVWIKKEEESLFEQFTRIGNGRITWLEVKHGLPFLLRIGQRAG